MLGTLADRSVRHGVLGGAGGAAGVNSAKLRKDLSFLGSYGIRGVGYDVRTLTEQISRTLGLTVHRSVALIGVGNLERHLGTPGLRLVRSRPRRHDDHRLQHVGRRLGPHLHLHAAAERDDRGGRRRGPRGQERQRTGPALGVALGIFGKRFLGKALGKTVKAIEARNADRVG